MLSKCSLYCSPYVSRFSKKQAAPMGGLLVGLSSYFKTIIFRLWVLSPALK